MTIVLGTMLDAGEIIWGEEAPSCKKAIHSFIDSFKHSVQIFLFAYQAPDSVLSAEKYSSKQN